MSAKTMDEMVAHVQAKASHDDAFRAAFLKDPRATVELEFGITLPPLGKVMAVESPADTFVVVLPPKPVGPSADGALSDADLEEVAGGKGGSKFKSQIMPSFPMPLLFPC